MRAAGPARRPPRRRGSQQSPWGDAIRLARRLSAGTTSELEVVRRVEDYLTSGRFRYTTDVDEPGPDPLLDFLFKTRAGYCQHFAGAAALLLRLAGVPTRVVSGFATGKRTGEDTYAVRDEDAHAWIEVYFPGYGWVPVQPDAGRAPRPTSRPRLDVLAAASRAAAAAARARRSRRWACSASVRLGAARRAPAPAPAPRSRSASCSRGSRPSPSARPRRSPRCARGWRRSARRSPRSPIEAERARFAADGTPEPAYPRLRVWRALARDAARCARRS